MLWTMSKMSCGHTLNIQNLEQCAKPGRHTKKRPSCGTKPYNIANGQKPMLAIQSTIRCCQPRALTVSPRPCETFA